ncbi:hypothetical protein T3H97_06315 [Paenibacillus sp. LX16]|uniref:hypothetical protein n=1 Tax=Paenibacillus sp. LX16 TaxID=1740264 RepID=UPI002E290DB5|nr:hypothetical protein [Paenibacillus sp. LX16]
MLVEVKEIQVRHNGTLYEKGASFSLPANQYERIKAHVIVLDEEDEPAADPDKDIDEMTVPELRAHAEKLRIDLGEATKKDDILEKIKAAAAAN